jgi:hypothetical protein
MLQKICKWNQSIYNTILWTMEMTETLVTMVSKLADEVAHIKIDNAELKKIISKV